MKTKWRKKGRGEIFTHMKCVFIYGEKKRQGKQFLFPNGHKSLQIVLHSFFFFFWFI